MNAARKGLLLLILQLVMVASLAARFLYDRAHYPRVWVKTVPFDPDLPIRGRYVRLSLIIDSDRPVPVATKASPKPHDWYCAKLQVRDGKLFGETKNDWNDCERAGYRGVAFVTLDEAVAYFIPEDAPDPSRVKEGEELWVEVTVPPKGPPRPIRLGIRKEGRISPLDRD